MRRGAGWLQDVDVQGAVAVVKETFAIANVMLQTRTQRFRLQPRSFQMQVNRFRLRIEHFRLSMNRSQVEIDVTGNVSTVLRQPKC